MFFTEEQTTELGAKFELTEDQLNELDAEFRAYDKKGGLQKFLTTRFNTGVSTMISSNMIFSTSTFQPEG